MRHLELYGVIDEVYLALYVCFDKEFETKKAGVWTGKVKGKVDLLEKNIGNHTFLAGNDLTWVDFFGYEWLLRVSLIWADEWKNYPNL